MSDIAQRKDDHLDLCRDRDVEGHSSNLLDEVQLLHEALPDLSVDEIDTSVEWLGQRLAAPIVVSGMTGGTERAGEINRALAEVAQKLGCAMGLGSQRAMLVNPRALASYRVRDCAPDILLLANIGLVQARAMSIEALQSMVESVGADALCVHLNVAQELVQDEGDRDFRGGLDSLRRFVEALPFPVVVKETGCGFSAATLARLRDAGIENVDVSGRGGTSWPAVEALRGSPRQRALGEILREWGVPTAASIVYARGAGLETMASGGVRDAWDVARALALGARVSGLALPFLRALATGGRSGLASFSERLVEDLRAIMLLVGARNVDALRSAPFIVGAELERWLEPPRTAGARASKGGGGEQGA